MRKKSISMLTAAVLTVCFCVTLLFSALPAASAATATDIAAQLSGISGLSAVEAPSGTVTVTGTASGVSSVINIDMNPGVTVIWKANLTGRASANNYVMNLSGSGTFNVEDATIANASTSAGGTIYISGGVTLNVNNNGVIDSPTTGTGSAVTVAGNVTGVVINVNSGGTVVSVPGGYAINDGSGFTQSTNNTQININNGGVVQAGTAGAIRSTGEKSVVTVNSGGLVTSSPSSNVSPVISMNYDPPPPSFTSYINNVVINGGTVRTTNSAAGSFVVQTSQNVIVQNNGIIQAINGRGINLVGEYSKATVASGSVTAVDGVAISSATTTLDKINHTSVEVTGGKVEAIGTGDAIHITGTDSKVTISAGQVLAKSGYAIDVDARVNGAPVTVSGGFVFAWGATIENVIHRYNSGKLNASVGGVIVGWNTTTGIGAYPYNQNSPTPDLIKLPDTATVYWDKNPNPNAGFDGIHVSGAGLSGNYFSLNVQVIQTQYTLTVIDRTGVIHAQSGIKTVGDTVSITAADGIAVDGGLGPPYNYPVNGTKFIGWSASGGYSGNILDSSALSTSITMPAADVVVTALYKPRYALNVVGGNLQTSPPAPEGNRNYGGSASNGYYAEGDIVYIEGNSSAAPPYSEPYTGPWIETAISAGGVFANKSNRETTFTMPGNPTSIMWAYGDHPTRPTPSNTYTATCVYGEINGTTGGGSFAPVYTYTGVAGTGLNISARSPNPDTEVFSHWIIFAGTHGIFYDPLSPDTVFVMLNENVTIEAVFVPAKLYNVHVWNGVDTKTNSVDATHKAGEAVTVIADTAPAGMQFTGWIVASGFDIARGGFITVPNTATAGFTMPADDVILIATYAIIGGADPGAGDIDGSSGSGRRRTADEANPDDELDDVPKTGDNSITNEIAATGAETYYAILIPCLLVSLAGLIIVIHRQKKNR